MKKLYTDYKLLWQTFNQSRDLKEIVGVLKNYLDKMSITYEIDYFSNFYIGDFTQEKPCLVSHIDSVHHKRSTKFHCKHNILSSNNGIGGDDKCGLVTCFEILKSGIDCNVIFCSDEEIGGIGAENIDQNKLKNIKYFIEIDRRGNDEIIFESGCNLMASDDFQKALKPVVNKFKLKEGFGSFTDVNILTELSQKCAINLCAGYYNAHSPQEYVNLEDLNKSIKIVKEILNTVTDTFIWDECNSFRYNQKYWGFSEPDIYSQQKNTYKNSVDEDYYPDYKHLDEILDDAMYYDLDDYVINMIESAYKLGKKNIDPFVYKKQNKIDSVLGNFDY